MQLSTLLRIGMSCFALVSLSGCIFGYYKPLPEDLRGHFQLSQEVLVEHCDLGPGFFSGSTDAKCLYPSAGRPCESRYEGVIGRMPPGTPVTLLWEHVTAGGSVQIKIATPTGTVYLVGYGDDPLHQLTNLLTRSR